MNVRNTASNPHATALEAIAHGMSGGDPSDFITDMEARGQQELVNSDVLPVDLSGGSRADFEAVGFTFGAPVPGDDLFVHATLPAGWSRQGSGHAMWSHIVDGLGRERVSIFYKAAFYDRSAHMSLTSVSGYALGCLNAWGDGGSTMPVLDDQWATRDAVVAALEASAVREDKDASEWEARLVGADEKRIADCSKYVTEGRGRAAKARALAADVRDA